MSFDLYVGEDDGDSLWVGNYTANMGAFFAWALDGTETADPTKRSDSRDAIFGDRHKDGIVALHEKPAGEVAEKVFRGLQRIYATDPRELARFDSPNGWGSAESATGFLEKILLACLREPLKPVRVSW